MIQDDVDDNKVIKKKEKKKNKTYIFMMQYASFFVPLVNTHRRINTLMLIPYKISFFDKS